MTSVGDLRPQFPNNGGARQAARKGCFLQQLIDQQPVTVRQSIGRLIVAAEIESDLTRIDALRAASQRRLDIFVVPNDI